MKPTLLWLSGSKKEELQQSVPQNMIISETVEHKDDIYKDDSQLIISEFNVVMKQLIN